MNKRLELLESNFQPLGNSLLISSPVSLCFRTFFFILIYNIIKNTDDITHFFCFDVHFICCKTEKYLKLSIDNSKYAKKNRTQQRKITTHRNKSRRISGKNNNADRNICKSRCPKKI